MLIHQFLDADSMGFHGGIMGIDQKYIQGIANVLYPCMISVKNIIANCFYYVLLVSLTLTVSK